jgi:hypothetical protein
MDRSINLTLTSTLGDNNADLNISVVTPKSSMICHLCSQLRFYCRSTGFIDSVDSGPSTKASTTGTNLCTGSRVGTGTLALLLKCYLIACLLGVYDVTKKKDNICLLLLQRESYANKRTYYCIGDKRGFSEGGGVFFFSAFFFLLFRNQKTCVGYVELRWRSE